MMPSRNAIVALVDAAAQAQVRKLSALVAARTGEDIDPRVTIPHVTLMAFEKNSNSIGRSLSSLAGTLSPCRFKAHGWLCFRNSLDGSTVLGLCVVRTNRLDRLHAVVSCAMAADVEGVSRFSETGHWIPHLTAYRGFASEALMKELSNIIANRRPGLEGDIVGLGLMGESIIGHRLVSEWRFPED